MPRLPLASPTTFKGATATPSRNSMKCSLPSRQRRAEPRGQRVHDRDATPWGRPRPCRSFVELAARMKLGEHDFGGRALRIVVVVVLDAGRDTATVVAHGARAVRVQRHLTRGCVARQTSSMALSTTRRSCGGDPSRRRCRRCTCTRPLAHGLEAFQHLDAVGTVVICGGFFQRFGAHSRLS